MRPKVQLRGEKTDAKKYPVQKSKLKKTPQIFDLLKMTLVSPGNAFHVNAFRGHQRKSFIAEKTHKGFGLSLTLYIDWCAEDVLL